MVASAFDTPLLGAAGRVRHVDFNPTVGIGPPEADDGADQFDRLVAIEHRAGMVREGRTAKRQQGRERD
jgi:hypothetical protein